ncbi:MULTISPECIES: magnesium transporter CorA family protein [unclassified Cyanobium]|uniref:magnesium transporter CorA family protein n=1 Tax=unclassified Cyanobium TaxID=2627006 RepID=UPI0020CEEFAB|nr:MULTISPECIES: magnesium transporter CorA family protein [unclassified Cyanobium]MCP9832765.1 magnesium transporter CorA family protein [Cyanobium sp. La Preciosa 7G6]MCP9935516.1 magnesium transporter CorA family protein [Cyanobium sp. Aljojuca 7A6]
MSDACFYQIGRDGPAKPVASAAAAIAAAEVDGFAWLHYREASREDLAELVGLLGLHALSIEDCFDDNQIPKIDDFPDNTFILFNTFQYDRGVLDVGEINLFLGKNFLVSISHVDAGQRSYLDGVERIVARGIEEARLGPSHLMHLILDNVVDQKFVAIEALEDELDRVEGALIADPASFKPAELIRFRRYLLRLRKSLFHEREILSKICRRDYPLISEQAIYHYRDIYDHLVRFYEVTESYRDIVTSLMEMYLSMLNNQMAKAANETNATVRRLTLITTIFMPLTLLAGIGGMSEWTMITGPNNWRVSYPAFMLAMVVIGFASYVFLNRLDRKRSGASRTRSRRPSPTTPSRTA